MFWDLLELSGELGLLLWLAAALFWAAACAALASWLGRPTRHGILLGAGLLVLGAAVLLTLEGVRRARAGRGGPLGAPRPRMSWGRRGYREAVVALALASAVALVVVTGLHDTELGLDVGLSGHLWLSVRDLGLTTVTVATALALVAAAMGSWRGPRRWPAVLVAWCGAWWLVWGAGALQVGDTLRVLVDSTGLADAVSAVVRVGTSWTLVLVLAGVLLAWSAALLVLVDRGSAVSPAPAGELGAGSRSIPTPRPQPDPYAAGWDNGWSGGSAGVGRPPQPPADPFSDGW